MIELTGEPGSSSVAAEQNNLRQELNKHKIQFRERYAYSATINALSLEIDSTNVDIVSKIPGVKRVTPIRKVGRPEIEIVRSLVDNKGLPFTHTMTGVDVLHDKHNLSGAGFKVGIVDTGIDYLHPGLGGGFGPKFRVAYGTDFVGDNYTGTNDPVPDDDPRDTCAGHGTHVAGIIGANDATFVGVAPQVTFGAYRVFGCKGSTSNDLIIAGLERAFKDGMDVVNLSLGGDSAWGDSPDAVVAQQLSRHGLIVVAAMGNAADKGLWEASSPAIAPRAFSVASLENIKYLAYTVALASNPSQKFAYANSKEGAGALNLTTTNVGIYDPTGTNLACDPLPVDLKGKVALVKRGSCTFLQKAQNAQKAGAIGVIVYNNVFGSIAPGVDDPSVTIPVVGLTQADGESLVASVKADPKAQLVFDPTQGVFPNPTGGRLSDFSSWGPGPRAEIKPDVGAPGGLIYSTFPLALGKYATLSGTSMATPYMAGSTVLYLEANKGKRRDLNHIHEVFQNTARPTTELGADQRTSPVARQGAGLINVERAIYGTTLVSPSRLALNDTEHGPLLNSQFVTITNTGNKGRTYHISHRPAAAVKGLDADGVALLKPELKDSAASVSFLSSSVYVPAGAQVPVLVRIRAPNDLPPAEHWVYSGYIVIDPATSRNATASPDAINVPYLGIKGNLRDLHVLKTTDALPVFQNVATNQTISKPSETATYTIANGDFPALAFRIEYPTSLVEALVFEAASNKQLGLIPGSYTQWVGRNDATDNSISGFNWPGTLVTGTDANQVTKDLPDGKYYVQLRALRPYGNAAKESDYDVWRSPTVEFKRAANATTVTALP